MKKIYQTVVNKGNGNCMQAAVASLFDLELHEVPNFIEHESPNMECMQFFIDRGYSACYIVNHQSTEYLFHQENRPPITDDNRYVYEMIDKNNAMKTNQPTFREIAEYDGGINGYFYCSVKSQTFENTYHAVICDTNLNIVHDPNPNGAALKLKECDIIDIIVVKDFYIDYDGSFKTLKE